MRPSQCRRKIRRGLVMSDAPIVADTSTETAIYKSVHVGKGWEIERIKVFCKCLIYPKICNNKNARYEIHHPPGLEVTLQNKEKEIAPIVETIERSTSIVQVFKLKKK